MKWVFVIGGLAMVAIGGIMKVHEMNKFKEPFISGNSPYYTIFMTGIIAVILGLSFDWIMSLDDEEEEAEAGEPEPEGEPPAEEKDDQQEQTPDDEAAADSPAGEAHEPPGQGEEPEGQGEPAEAAQGADQEAPPPEPAEGAGQAKDAGDQ